MYSFSNIIITQQIILHPYIRLDQTSESVTFSMPINNERAPKVLHPEVKGGETQGYIGFALL